MSFEQAWAVTSSASRRSYDVVERHGTSIWNMSGSTHVASTKRSSAELSEAINSMHQWYSAAKTCYVYLVDYLHSEELNEQTQDVITRSSWFQRGWTLQELLAPKKVVFFDQQWESFGLRNSLGDRLADITGIPVYVLAGTVSPQKYSVAQRLSWASTRTTTRPEDMAYSLLGIFDVNMPLLYGEGRKAFERLQLAIIQQSDDECIFAWEREELTVGGLLAPDPKVFKNAGNIHKLSSPSGRDPYHMTNKGLALTCRMLSWRWSMYLLPLQCGRVECIEKRQIYGVALYVCLGLQKGQFFRVTHEDESFLFLDSTLQHPAVTEDDRSIDSPDLAMLGQSMSRFLRDFPPTILHVPQRSHSFNSPFGHHRM